MATLYTRHDDELLVSVGLPAREVAAWRKAYPRKAGSFAADRKTFSAYWQKTSRLLGQLPPPARQTDTEDLAARLVCGAAIEARKLFLRAHVDAVYDALTAKRTRFVRLEDLVPAAAKLVPGLVPSPKDIAAEEGLLQSEKAGLEIDQGHFVSEVLRSEQSGRHLCHAMLLPRQEIADELPKFMDSGRAEFPGASIERRGKAAILTFKNPRFLNAEDQTTLAGMEICVDLALLDAELRSSSCAAAWWSIRNTKTGECSAPAST